MMAELFVLWTCDDFGSCEKDLEVNKRKIKITNVDTLLILNRSFQYLFLITQIIRMYATPLLFSAPLELTSHTFVYSLKFGAIQSVHVRSVSSSGPDSYRNENRRLKNGLYSHSIVAGGFELISYTTRLIPFTLLIISFDTFPKNSYGKWHQSAVIPSVLVTARKAIAFS